MSIELPHLYSGKVRDLYDAGSDRLLMVATDRLSIFDVILPSPVPDKGRVLTAISSYWFEATSDLIDNHVIAVDPSGFPEGVGPEFAGRATLVERTTPVRMECIARGYLFGGAWKEYSGSTTVQGRSMPSGLLEASELPEPIFTPTTKPDFGHDMPMTDAEAIDLVGADRFEEIRSATLAVYARGAAMAKERGIILADTKLEFGLRPDGSLLLIDEVLTPDSSRYWPGESYAPGGSPPSFDKQYVRDHYLAIGWNQEPPAPPVPSEVIEGTRGRYIEAYERLTGLRFSDWYGG